MATSHSQIRESLKRRRKALLITPTDVIFPIGSTAKPLSRNTSNGAALILSYPGFEPAMIASPSPSGLLRAVQGVSKYIVARESSA